MVLEKSNLILSLSIITNGLGKPFVKVNEYISLVFNYRCVCSSASVPIVPPLTNDEDTSNFDEIEKTDGPAEESFSVSKNFVGNQLSFVGFSYSNEQQ